MGQALEPTSHLRKYLSPSSSPQSHPLLLSSSLSPSCLCPETDAVCNAGPLPEVEVMHLMFNSVFPVSKRDTVAFKAIKTLDDGSPPSRSNHIPHSSQCEPFGSHPQLERNLTHHPLFLIPRSTPLYPTLQAHPLIPRVPLT